MNPSEAADRVALRGLVDAYGIAVDERDAVAYTALFVPDGRLTVYAYGAAEPTAEFEGHDGLRGVMDVVAPYAETFHLVGNHRCALDGDAATGRTYCLAYHLRTGAAPPSRMLLVVRYRDAYVRVRGEWLFAHRDAFLLWREVGPVKQAPPSPQP